MSIGGVGGFLGEARLSVVESSKYSGVVGSVGPWICSCEAVSWVVCGFCSASVISGCSCIVWVCCGWSVSYDVGGGGNWHYGHMKGSSSSSIVFLQAWCIIERQSGETHCWNVCCIALSLQTTHKSLVGVSSLKHVLQKNVLDFVRVFRSMYTCFMCFAGALCTRMV